jgi:hypothetical protein
MLRPVFSKDNTTQPHFMPMRKWPENTAPLHAHEKMASIAAHGQAGEPLACHTHAAYLITTNVPAGRDSKTPGRVDPRTQMPSHRTCFNASSVMRRNGRLIGIQNPWTCSPKNTTPSHRTCFDASSMTRGNSSLMGASKDFATVTMTGVKKTQKMS